jgi:ATP-binding cassette subfamily F protein 3
MMAKAHPEILPQDALNMAGSLLFSGEDVNKKISVLSGGERSRVAIGQILLQRSPCLILDEPTNHLDFQTVEALTQALSHYPGTVVAVSHDRSFRRRLGKKIIEINHGQVTLYPGTYDDYVWSLQNGVLKQRDFLEEKVGPSPVSGGPAKFNYKETKKSLEREIRKCEKIISDSDNLLKELNNRLLSLNDAIMASESQSPGEAIKEIGVVQAQIQSLEEEWLKASERKEELEKSLEDL